MKDPERFLEERGVTVRCVVARTRPARLQAAYRAQVNYEIFYFSDSTALRRFRRDPLAYVGKVTDPVSHLRFRPTPTSPHTEFQGRWYYFAGPQYLETFLAKPDSFANRRGA